MNFESIRLQYIGFFSNKKTFFSHISQTADFAFQDAKYYKPITYEDISQLSDFLDLKIFFIYRQNSFQYNASIFSI